MTFWKWHKISWSSKAKTNCHIFRADDLAQYILIWSKICLQNRNVLRNNICSESSGGWTSLFWCLGCLRDGVQQSRIMINVLNLGQFWATAWSQLKKWWWWSLCWDCNPNAPRSLTPLFKQGGRLVAWLLWLRTWKWQPLLEDFAVVQCDVNIVINFI